MMKRTIILFLASFIALSIVAKPPPPPTTTQSSSTTTNPKETTQSSSSTTTKPSATTLNVSSTIVTFDASGGTATLHVSTNASTWEIEDESLWCPASISGNTITLYCRANENDSRSDFFHVKAGNKRVKIEIFQGEKPEYFASDADRLKITDVKFANVDYVGNIINTYGSALYDTTAFLKPKITFDNLARKPQTITVYLKIFSPDGVLKSGASKGYTYSDKINLSGEYKKSEVQQINHLGDKGKNYWSPGTYTFEIWYSDRKLYTQQFEIKNKGASSTTLSVSDTEVVFEASGGTKTIRVYTNASYSTSSTFAWCTKAQYSDYFTLTCSANTDAAERKDESFYVKAGDKSVQVRIRQKGKTVSASESSSGATALEKGEWRSTMLNTKANETQSYDNDKYKGQMYSNNRSGLGAYYWDEVGDSYWGAWSSGSMSGEGIYIVGNSSSSRYIDNCPDCKYYAGNWSSGVKSGTGYCYDKTGKMIYGGAFSNGKPTETYPQSSTGSKYKFECIEYAGGGKYVGETKEGKPHGLGIFFWTDGNAWYGTWSEGLRAGKGIVLFYNGALKVGKWKGDDYSEN